MRAGANQAGRFIPGTSGPLRGRLWQQKLCATPWPGLAFGQNVQLPTAVARHAYEMTIDVFLMIAL